jgi:acetoin utilization deacetylase AcuC-like enzyme
LTGKKISFVTHPDCEKHFSTYNHPESPERTRKVAKLAEDSRLGIHMELVCPHPAEIDTAMLIHPRRYLEKLRSACVNGNYWFDYEDTFINKFSYDVALLSAGGAIEAVRRVLSSTSDRAFCSIRPPGHHASREQGMGFCLINNIAIAARYAQKRCGVEKVLIFDWDAHHGNGTQSIFEEDPTVYYISIHEHPTFIFPGTGRRWEAGTGSGRGYTMNIPLPPGAGDKEYIQSVENHVIPVIKSFAPELILISAGFDAHRDDLLSDMNVTAKGFGKMTAMMMKASVEYSTGKVVSVLEGGYNLEALDESVRAHLEEMIFCDKEEKCLYSEE